MTLTNSLNGFDGAQELLIKLVEQSPEDWETRKRVVQVLYDSGLYRDASKLVWNAPEIPPVTEDIVFTARVVAMGQPERAVRLVSTMIESNQDDPAENLKVAKALMKQGLTLQALRFYGAATAQDPEAIDDDFELALVNADCGGETWRDMAEGEDFPWDGPQETSISDMIDEEGTGEASAAEILLSSVTQRVPLKAPVKAGGKDAESPSATPPAEKQAAAPVKPPKPILSPAAEALVNQQSESSGEAASPQANEDGSFSSLVNFFKHKEMTQDQEMESPDQAPVKSQPLATIATSVDTREHGSVDTRPELPPAPSSPLVQGFQPRPSEPLTEAVPEVAVAPPEPAAGNPEGAPVFSREQTETPAPQQESVAVQAPRPSEAVVENKKPISGQLAPVVEPTLQAPAPESSPPAPAPEPEPQHQQQAQQPQQEEDLSDVVASALAEREVGPPEATGGGLISKIKRVFGRSKADAGDGHANENAPAEPAPAQAQAVSSASAPVAQKAPQSSAMVQVAAPAQAATPMSTTVLRKPQQEQHEPPKELDGRTQLVALAPEDGSVYFDQLSAKYNQVADGQLPQTAVVARDMANVDYVQLIREACNKDLNAFSKLLGLHRVMTESHCTSWVEDMDLLRKGYGDAVLATVVSKYSVAECREILGAVYQRPGAQAAAV